ncbi:methionyl-tRNA formyltransferase [Diaphorobacter sp.]|uniref:methionyl-tRNA formyltransferase n=1 Tax=Diaphorobacter sp. TaxID=1934310 RepID=UPI003D0C9897
MRVIFAGTPDFARVALEQLLAAGHAVPLVLTQPDRPAGRGMKLQASPVKQCAQQHGIAVAQPLSLRLDGKYPEDAAAARAAIDAAQADVMVVAAYGLILPQWVLDTMSAARPPEGAKAPPGGSEPRAAGSVGARGLGCLNIHASVLPRWRGAAPIHRAIEAGDAETGVTIMQMDAGLDTGDMLLLEKTAITPADTTATLHDRLASLGGRLIVQALDLAARGALVATPQPGEGVTYAHKIDKAESTIDWRDSAEVIARRVRAFDPFPGAATTLGADVIKVWGCEIDSCSRPSGVGCGQILHVGDDGITVACGTGSAGGSGSGGSALRLTVLQRAGGKRLPAAQFLRGFALAPGMVLGAADGSAAP